MDQSLRNTPALLNRIDKLTSTLISRYLKILDLAQLPPTTTSPAHEPTSGDSSEQHATRVDLSKKAVDTVRSGVELQGLIKAAQDLAGLTRGLKEGWLFGGLEGGVLGEGIGDEVGKGDGDVDAVRMGLGRWVVGLEDGEGEVQVGNGEGSG
ncbi:MAG: hypothetical protein M1828_000972 [Chrysothrix sp. TS-e1954]|nr:MAG: hypothetical protein M1828_000972 [Chrysothrix sp. TS-e1954]